MDVSQQNLNKLAKAFRGTPGFLMFLENVQKQAIMAQEQLNYCQNLLDQLLKGEK